VAPTLIGKRWDKAVAGAGHGRNEPRSPIVVLQLDPERSNVAIDDVAFRNEIGPPDRVKDLVSRDDAPGSAGEQVQKALFDAG
jgi:hypothetical protein